MNRLTEIGIKHGTDKAEYHEFTEFYEPFFEQFKKPNLLEVGIIDDASLKMYDEFFDGKAKIVGIDPDHKAHFFANSRTITALRGNVLLPEAVEKCRHALKGELYDIIIDDGGHTMEQQQLTLVNLWPLLKPGGLFIIEDLHTSSNNDFNPKMTTTTLAMLKGLQTGEIIPSLYIEGDQLKELNDEMADVLIWEKDWPQQGTLSPRSSITSVITKTSDATPKPLRTTGAKEVNKNKGTLSGKNTEPIVLQNIEVKITEIKEVEEKAEQPKTLNEIQSIGRMDRSETVSNSTNEAFIKEIQELTADKERLQEALQDKNREIAILTGELATLKIVLQKDTPKK